jgi:hypothetical protein
MTSDVEHALEVVNRKVELTNMLWVVVVPYLTTLGPQVP